VVPASTFTSAMAGKNFDSGSVSWNRPSSYSMSSATEVTGLVMLYMRNRSLVRVRRPVARSAMP